MPKGSDFRPEFYYNVEFCSLAEGHEIHRKIIFKGKLNYFSSYFRKKYRVAYDVIRCHLEPLGEK